MANILVFTDLRSGIPSTPSRFALGEARRVAGELGATVYAVVATGDIVPEAIDSLTNDLGLAGADKILFCSDAVVEKAPLDATHGGLLTVLADRLQPLLFLFPAGGSGPELGPPLALRSGATYCPRVQLEILPGLGAADPTHGPRLILRYARARRDRLRVLDLAPSHRAQPVVATLPAGFPPHAPPGGVAAEIQMVRCPATVECPIDEISTTPDPTSAIELASTVLVVDRELAMSRTSTTPLANVALASVEDPALSLACPALLIYLGASGLDGGAVAVSPTTHVALIGPAGMVRQPPPFVDLTWQIDEAERTRAVDEIVEALAAAGLS